MKAVNPRTVKRKIRSVQNIKKITKAMEMVSAAKLKKVQGRLLAIRPYSDKIRELVKDVSEQAKDIDVPMLKPRPEVRRKAFVVITSDKGLCGAYNANALRLATRTTAVEAGSADLYAIGKKGAELFKRRGPVPVASWIGLPVGVDFKKVREITQQVIGAYRREQVDEVYVIYTEYVSAATVTPRVLKFLPMETATALALGATKKKPSTSTSPSTSTKKELAYGYIFEPEPARILAALIPRYVEVLFYRILLEAMASEHAARMSAMRNATDNAQELIDTLTLTYNKARQASITKELLDIVGGAEALKG